VRQQAIKTLNKNRAADLFLGSLLNETVGLFHFGSGPECLAIKLNTPDPDIPIPYLSAWPKFTGKVFTGASSLSRNRAQKSVAPPPSFTGKT
jgi:hypothetical protein